ncbi:MAG: pilus assembly protein PilP [Nitrosomonas sp.]|uniref:pilus assembly protein PilP n=1 Tax=Nitrosomonas sp. TaxID=42353 RepID=UPI0025E8C8D6|nr:pilus assembly protein PilP [Nitrosomonas sp.]MBY0475908.1 pilus assembly protein PilP [Nitrosomonas sp.]
MIRNIYLLVLIIIWFNLITACSRGDYSDLEAFIHSSGEGLQGKIDPLPEVVPYKSFTYQVFDMPSPFLPRKNNQVQAPTSEIQPDLNRRKEFLESYPLENLSMVGSLQQHDMIFAVIKSPDGALYRVKVGNYLGSNFGKISYIAESEVKLLEIVQDGVNEWIERTSALTLKN